MNKVVLLKKLMKITFILALVAFLTWKTVICLRHYLGNPTYTTNRYVNQDETDFPAMTICPAYPLGYKKKKLSNFGIAEENYWNTETCHSNMTWSSSIAVNTSAEDLFHKVTYQFSELVNKIRIGYFNSDVSFLTKIKHTQKLLILHSIIEKELQWIYS